MGKYSFYSLIIILSFASGGHAWRSYIINITKLATKCDENIGSVMSNLTQGKSSSKLNSVFTLKQDIGAPVYINVGIFQEVEDEYLPYFFNVTFDFCQVIKKTILSPVVDVIFEDIFAHNDVPRRCPIVKNTYHLMDYEPNVDQFPPYIPNNNYRLDLRFLKNKENLNDYMCYSQIYSTVENFSDLRRLASAIF